MKTEPDGQTVCLSLMVPEWPARQEKAASAIDLLTALLGPGNDILTSAVNQPSLQQSDPSRGDEQDRHLDPQALKDSPTDRLPQAATSAGHAGQHHQHGNPACPRQATL
jgi:hypothetical protein